MHTTEGREILFHHDGDFSGDVHMIVAADRVFERPQDYEVRIPFEDLKTLVAEYVRRRAVSQMEQMDPDEVLSKVTFDGN